MFDLGSLDYNRLGRIENNDGWFACRLNADANPYVIDESRTLRGNSIDLEGTHLQEVLPDLYRQTIDVTATVGAGQDDHTFPTICEPSAFDTRTMKTPQPIVTTLTTSTTSTRRIFPEGNSRREFSRHCIATDGASNPFGRSNRRRCIGSGPIRHCEFSSEPGRERAAVRGRATGV